MTLAWHWAQYNLDTEAPNVSMLSSSKFDKYEYLTGKDLCYKSGTIEQAKFEYFPLHQIFNKDLERDDKTNGLLKRLWNG